MLLTDLVKGKDYEFLNRFQSFEETGWDKIKRVVSFEPEFMGIKLAGNKVADILRTRVRGADDGF
jgi:hypothetical protein